MGIKLAYITTSFETISHTFIRTEVTALRKAGVEIDLYGIRPNGNMPKWKSNYLYPVNPLVLIRSFLSVFLKKPKNTLKTFFITILSKEKSFYQYLKLIYHFFLSCVYAEKFMEKKYKHIHSHFINVPSTIALFCSSITEIPFTVTVHSLGAFNLDDTNLVKAKLLNSSNIRVVSESIKKEIESFSKEIKNIKLIRTSLDFNQNILNSSNVKKQTNHIIAVGRLVEKKGFSYLIQAVNNLNKIENKYYLQIIGDGPLFSELKKEAKSEKIKLLGEKSHEETLELIASNDILIAPSVKAESGEQEGLPMVILEAMALKTNIIATKHSGIPEVIKDQENGFLVAQANVFEIENAIEKLISNADFRKKLSSNAYDFVRHNFNSELISKELLALWI